MYIYRHVCQKPVSLSTEKYIIRECKACVEKIKINKKRAELEDLMKVSISWDEECVFV